MTILHRWEKGEDFIEIEKGFSTDLNGPALVVNASPAIPGEFRDQVPASGDADLVSRVERWASKRGYKKVQ